jgi:hypothetical protein
MQTPRNTIWMRLAVLVAVAGAVLLVIFYRS